MCVNSVYLTACNIKKLDTKFYGITKPRCHVIVKCNGQSYTTKDLPGLDPEWEEEARELKQSAAAHLCLSCPALLTPRLNIRSKGTAIVHPYSCDYLPREVFRELKLKWQRHF